MKGQYFGRHGSSDSVFRIREKLSYLQFPPAAANAMVLLLAVLLMIGALMRLVDIRKEL